MSEGEKSAARLTAADLRCGQEFVGVDGITLTVSGVSYGTAIVAEVLAGEATAVHAIATQDGRHVVAEWAELGTETTGEEIFYEKFDLTGRYAHGWVDAVSRKVVQTG